MGGLTRAKGWHKMRISDLEPEKTRIYFRDDGSRVCPCRYHQAMQRKLLLMEIVFGWRVKWGFAWAD